MPANRRSRLLPELELEVIKILWKLGTASVADVQKQLEPRRPLAYTTVMTVLERLTRKRVAARWKKGRGYRYQATWSQEEARELAVKRLLADFFDGSFEQLAGYVEENGDGAVTVMRSHTRPNGGARRQVEGLDSSLL